MQSKRNILTIPADVTKINDANTCFLTFILDNGTHYFEWFNRNTTFKEIKTFLIAFLSKTGVENHIQKISLSTFLNDKQTELPDNQTLAFISKTETSFAINVKTR